MSHSSTILLELEQFRKVNWYTVDSSWTLIWYWILVIMTSIYWVCGTTVLFLLSLRRELLDEVARLERTHVTTTSPSHPFIPRNPTQLEPINSLGGDTLLQAVSEVVAAFVLARFVYKVSLLRR